MSTLPIYNTTAPTPNAGQTVAPQADSLGNLYVNPYTKLAGEDLGNDVMKVEQQMNPTNITTATTTTVKSGAGYFECITINATAAGTITIYDNTAASGTKIATIKASIVESSYFYYAKFVNGLTIVTAGAGDVTVAWR